MLRDSVQASLRPSGSRASCYCSANVQLHLFSMLVNVKQHPSEGGFLLAGSTLAQALTEP